MISRIALRNFRSIGKLDLTLHPLNVLIGRNGSGKSNFLSFFSLLGEGARGNLNRTIINSLRGYEFLRFLKADLSESIEWEIDFETASTVYGGQLRYAARLGPRGGAGYALQSEIISRPPYSGYTDRYKFLEVRDGRLTILKTASEQVDDSFDGLDQELAIAQIRNPVRYPAITEVNNALREWVVFNGFGEQELRQIRAPQILNVVDPLRLDPSGVNLVSVLYALTNQPEYEDTYARLTDIMRAVFPDFSKFDLPLVAGGQASIALRLKDLPKSIPALFMSDGQLRFLGLIMLLLLPNPPNLILIDEPEIGMHPKMIDIFAEVVHETAKRTQVIISTHSPQLIDSIAPEDLLVVEREDGATTINRVDLTRLTRWLERYKPGYLWTHSTLIGG